MSTHFKHDVPSPSSLASTKFNFQVHIWYHLSPPPPKKVLHFVIGYDKV